MGTKVLGIDPALGTTGYGLLLLEHDKLQVIDAGVVRCRRDVALELRLKELSAGIRELIDELQPDCVAVEQLYTHYQRPTTAILMGHARGVILLAAAEANLPISSYAATRVKKTLTGNGRASKAQMQFAIQNELGLSAPPTPDDVADALAVALTHCHFQRAQASGLRL